MSLTSYDVTDGIATITMDDGKVNALSVEMLSDVSERFDRAEADDAQVLILTGARTTFSAGFDLRTEAEGWPPMLLAGARLAERIMSFPKPVVAACNGNALAMGAFLLLSADYRVGARGEFKIGLNEVMIGLTLPWFGIEIARHRLTRPYFDRCTITGIALEPEEARAAGFLDGVVEATELDSAAAGAARELAAVKPDAHAATKLRVRERALAGVRDGIARLEGEDPRKW